LDHKIPPQVLNRFHRFNDIVPGQYNVPDRKNFSAVDSLAPALGEMYQITAAETHDVKAAHLRPLRKFFQPHIDAGYKVKFIFVVPPNRFEMYKAQKFVGSGSAEPKDETEKDKIDVKDITKSNTKRGTTTKSVPKSEDLDGEFDSWIEQWVMEVNVDPLTTFDQRISYEMKKTFKEKFLLPLTPRKK
jgi:hypothetical protein